MPASLPEKIVEQMRKAGLPTSGQHTFQPRLMTNRKGEPVIEKRAVTKGPKRGKRGYVDDQGRIWIKDRSHVGVADHWDVQINEGEDYFRVDLNGDEVP